MKNNLMEKIAITVGIIFVIAIIAFIFLFKKEDNNNQEEMVLNETVNVEEKVAKKEVEKVEEKTDELIKKEDNKNELKEDVEVIKKEKNNLEAEDFSLEIKQGVVYFGGVEVKDAVISSFTVLRKEVAYGVGSNSRYAEDEFNVYERYCLSSKEELKCFVEIMPGVKPGDLIVFSDFYAKDSKNVYFRELNKKSTIIDGAEQFTFVQIDYGSAYAEDKNNCYYMGEIRDMSECENDK